VAPRLQKEEQFLSRRVCSSLFIPCDAIFSEAFMAKGRVAKRRKAKRKYAPSVGKDVEREMRRFERGTARSGPGGKGGKVKSRKQAIAIALSEARKEGKRLPKRPAKRS
jgi:Family of unknown function (DUF6496)